MVKHLAKNYDLYLILAYRDAKKNHNSFLCSLFLGEIQRCAGA